MSEDTTAASNRPAHSLDRVWRAIAGLEPAVFEEAISFLQSPRKSPRKSLPRKSLREGASSSGTSSSELLAPLPRHTALRTLRLAARFARHGQDQTQAEVARDVDRYQAYARMTPEKRRHLAEALTGSLARPVLDLLVLAAMEDE